MKRRLRKKLHKAEFQEHGFNLEFDLSETDNKDFFEKFLDSFLIEAIEGNGLECGGGGREHQEFFIVRNRGSVSEEQLNAVKEWLEKQPQVSNIVLGKLRDAWYGWE